MNDKAKDQSAQVGTSGPYTPPEISELGTVEDLTFGSDSYGSHDGTTPFYNNYSYPG